MRFKILEKTCSVVPANEQRERQPGPITPGADVPTDVSTPSIRCGDTAYGSRLALALLACRDDAG
jgi:hypothetical protein